MITTLLIILEQATIHMPVIIGAYISISMMQIPNLSIESAYLAGAICGYHVLHLLPYAPQPLMLLLAICASLIGGACIGLLLSILHIYGNIPYLLGSIIIIGLCHGISQLLIPLYCTMSQMDNPLICMLIKKHPELLIMGLITLVLIIGIGLLFNRQLGYCFAIYGNNPKFFQYSTINRSYIITSGLMISNALAGLSGYLFAQSNGFIELHMAAAKALLCITAIVLANSIIKQRSAFSLVIPLVGTLAYFSLQQALLKVGFNLRYFTAVQAIIILIVVVIIYRNKPLTAQNNELGI